MAEMNLKQITDRLNAEFAGQGRRIVFWYDDNGDFAGDVDSLPLENAKLHKLEPGNQFYTKYLLERVDPDSNYLIYAPFPKPDVKDNHLEDTLLYSKRFYADRVSLMLLDLGIPPELKPEVEKYSLFFGDKTRTSRFYNLGIETYNRDTIPVGIMAALCGVKSCAFEAVLEAVLNKDLEDNALLAEFEKYRLTEAFWDQCSRNLGYLDQTPTLKKLLMTLFATAASRQMDGEIPQNWTTFVSGKPGNVLAFLDRLINNVQYQQRFDFLSDLAAKELGVEKAFSAISPELLTESDIFREADRVLIRWMTGRLLDEDLGAKLGSTDVPTLCQKRVHTHFGKQYEGEYELLRNAHFLVGAANYRCSGIFTEIAAQYESQDYRIDQAYRHFYEALDRLEDSASYESLRNLVENIYTNEYLGKLLPAWNEALVEEPMSLPLQRNFFERQLGKSKERTAVIISDAMRYEVGQELFQKFADDEKSTSKLEVQASVLPSYTRLGMAALLPHDTLTMTDDYQVLADGVLCDTLEGREKVLRGHVPESVCVQFDSIKNLTSSGMRQIFTGKQIVYIYHNQIDARGDKPNTEDEVFVACREAVQEIFDLIHNISSKGNTHSFIVTADHGFLYKRDKLQESDKIGGVTDKNAWINRRYIVAQKPVKEDGVKSVSLGVILGNDDAKYVSFPIGDSVFKVPGGGQNFVHGGSSPQEIIVPVLSVKLERGKVETSTAEITINSLTRKITNLITTLDFLQTEPVSDTVKEAAYKVFFVSENGDRISDENTFIANSRETDSQKRIVRLRFTFKNQKYDRNRQYYLVACNAATGIELFRTPMIMDIAFADDFGFGF